MARRATEGPAQAQTAQRRGRTEMVGWRAPLEQGLHLGFAGEYDLRKGE